MTTNLMAENDIAPIDLIVMNLYAFEETVRGGADFATCVENIDIGSLYARAAAKNHNFTTIVIDPQQYQSVMVDMEAHAGGTTEELQTTPPPLCENGGLRRRDCDMVQRTSRRTILKVLRAW